MSAIEIGEICEDRTDCRLERNKLESTWNYI